VHAATVEIDPGSVRKARGSIRDTRHLRTLDELDGRTRASQRTRELLGSIHADLGGLDRLTQAQIQLAQRAAVLGALLEDRETRWAAGEEFHLDEYLSAINAQRRVFATLGLKREPRDVTPAIDSYLARQARAEPAGGDLEVEP